MLDAARYNRLWFDQSRKRGGAYLHGLLSQSIEQFAARFGFAAVESDGELIQVSVQMLLPNRALVRAQQPSLQQRDHTMYPRKEMLSLFLMALYLAVMNISFQPKIASPAVGSDRASRRNRLSNELVQARAGRV